MITLNHSKVPINIVVDMENVLEKVDKYSTLTFSMKVWLLLVFKLKSLIHIISFFGGLEGLKQTAYIRDF